MKKIFLFINAMFCCGLVAPSKGLDPEFYNLSELFDQITGLDKPVLTAENLAKLGGTVARPATSTIEAVQDYYLPNRKSLTSQKPKKKIEHNAKVDKTSISGEAVKRFYSLPPHNRLGRRMNPINLEAINLELGHSSNIAKTL